MGVSVTPNASLKSSTDCTLYIFL